MVDAEQPCRNRLTFGPGDRQAPRTGGDDPERDGDPYGDAALSFSDRHGREAWDCGRGRLRHVVEIENGGTFDRDRARSMSAETHRARHGRPTARFVAPGRKNTRPTRGRATRRFCPLAQRAAKWYHVTVFGKQEVRPLPRIQIVESKPDLPAHYGSVHPRTGLTPWLAGFIMPKWK